ncbi:uncharacterized protein LOC132030259 isoform X1 [Lycium ferocissimum]|uniref:uncharacterized protein LOC132030259 isoform X1 n=1 Tax=Lycium ferocissimum TaxID=112874 RepID=UPI002814A90C|nr:uncharacterized protein LOC132030259 isoform X1 [Lycium ferocissimum]
MAASSPALSNHSADSAPSPSPSPAPAVSTANAAVLSSLPTTTNASKNLRGLNKPKCIKCGNVARSRCPFQSCKNCCAKAQNPCHIHVLKGGSTLPEKIPSSGSPVVDQQSTEAPHSGSSHRATSLRQLSSNFAQFNNLQTPIRSRKPLTRKDAQLINEWRFMKLKEYRDSNVAAENEAFDRYMQNVGLLEEVFAVNSAEDDQNEDEKNEGGSTEDDNEAMINRLKLQLRSDPARAENTRKRMQYIVDQGLRKLRKLESGDNATALSDLDALGKKKKAKTAEAEHVAAFTDLIDKLNKARNEEDLKACLEMKSKLFNQPKKEKQAESDDTEAFIEQSSKASVVPPTMPSGNSPPKWFSTATVDDEELRRLNAEFDSLEDIEEL